jgi:NTE family protein
MSAWPLALALAFAGPALAQPVALPKPLTPTPRVGVVLSGGGPRGKAHLGVLRALEQARVPVDLIIGTSAGSLVGALYAQSFDLDRVQRQLRQLDFIAMVADDAVARRHLVFLERERDFNYLSGLQLGLGPGGLRTPGGLSSGRRLRWALRRLFAPSVAVRDFTRLAVPFRAAATDLAHGEGVILQDGDLAEAVMASTSVPGAFAPMRLGDAVLVDGLIFRNLPVDAAREARHLIVVDITTPFQARQDYPNLGSVAMGLVDVMIHQNTLRQLSLLGPQDLLLRPADGGLGDFDYARADESIPLGAAAVTAEAARLAPWALAPDAYQAWRAQRQALALTRTPILSGVRAAPGADAAVLQGLGQRLGQEPDFNALNEGLEDLMGTGLYEDVDFRLEPTQPGQADLVVEPRRKSWGPDALDVGLKLMSDFEGRSEFELLLQLTQRSLDNDRVWRHQVFAGRVNGIGTELIQPLGLGLFVAPGAEIQDRLAILASLGQVQVQHATAGVDLGAWLGRGAEWRLGWHGGRLWSPQWGGFEQGVPLGALQTSLVVDTLDDPHFPSKGTYLNAGVTDARGSVVGPSAYDVARAALHQAFSRGRLVLLLGGELVSSFGEALPVFEQGSLGGFMRLGGYREGQFSGDEEWLGRALLLWRQPHPGALIAKTTAIGVSVEAGNTGIRPWDSFAGTHGSAAAYLGLDTPLGPFYLAHARNPEGGGVSYVCLGNPF